MMSSGTFWYSRFQYKCHTTGVYFGFLVGKVFSLGFAKKFAKEDFGFAKKLWITFVIYVLYQEGGLDYSFFIVLSLILHVVNWDKVWDLKTLLNVKVRSIMASVFCLRQMRSIHFRKYWNGIKVSSFLIGTSRRYPLSLIKGSALNFFTDSRSKISCVTSVKTRFLSPMISDWKIGASGFYYFHVCRLNGF